MSKNTESYSEYRARIREEQASTPPDKIKEQLENQSEYVLDLNNLPGQDHRWVDRGTVMSCEGGSHPHHQAFKRR